jgi:hypothetical protein
MTDWHHCFGLVVRKYTMAGTCGGARPLTSWPESKEKEEEDRSYNPL